MSTGWAWFTKNHQGKCFISLRNRFRQRLKKANLSQNNPIQWTPRILGLVASGNVILLNVVLSMLYHLV